MRTPQYCLSVVCRFAFFWPKEFLGDHMMCHKRDEEGNKDEGDHGYYPYTTFVANVL